MVIRTWVFRDAWTGAVTNIIPRFDTNVVVKVSTECVTGGSCVISNTEWNNREMENKKKNQNGEFQNILAEKQTKTILYIQNSDQRTNSHEGFSLSNKLICKHTFSL